MYVTTDMFFLFEVFLLGFCILDLDGSGLSPQTGTAPNLVGPASSSASIFQALHESRQPIHT